MFKPDEHKRGYAYWNGSNDGPIYPSGYTHDGRVYFQNKCQVRDCPFDKLTRAPEHDLLPWAEVEKLVEALEGTQAVLAFDLRNLIEEGKDFNQAVRDIFDRNAKALKPYATQPIAGEE